MAMLNIIRNHWLSITSQKCFFRPNLSIFGTPNFFQHKSDNINVLDIFTTRLLNEQPEIDLKTPKKEPASLNVLQNENRSKMLKKIAAGHSKVIGNDGFIKIAEWTKQEIDDCVSIVIDCNDKKTFNELFEQIIELKRLPSDGNVLRIFYFICDDSAASMDKVMQLIDVCKEENMEFYARSMAFAPFLAQYLWKMERFDDALSTLVEIYPTTDESVKSSVLRNFRQIIFDAIRNQDEGTVQKLLQSAKKIFEKRNSPTILVYIWADCFYSALFSNQMIANGIFEEYEIVRKIISTDVGWIVLSLIQQHNIDGLQRLIEQCLKFGLKEECGTCMRALFDYHCKYSIVCAHNIFNIKIGWTFFFLIESVFGFTDSRRNLRACSEMRKTSLRLDIPLSKEQNKKLLQLANAPPKPNEQPKDHKPTSSRFEFKF